MHKILVTTDIHITRPGKQIIGLDPVERFTRVLAKAASDHPDADRMIVTGDLTHWGGANEYDRLKQCLGGLPWPVDLMMGNHDNRENFRRAFPDAPTTAAGHVQQIIDLPGWRLITLDSHDETYTEPVHSGFLCEDRLDWLREALSGAKDAQIVVFIHHPPLRTFFDGMDEIGLRNIEALLGILEGAPRMRHVIAGHIHRTMSGSARGLPVTIFKSPCHQAPLTIGPSSHSDSIDEPGAYGIVLLHDDGVTVHSEDVF